MIVKRFLKRVGLWGLCSAWSRDSSGASFSQWSRISPWIKNFVAGEHFNHL